MIVNEKLTSFEGGGSERLSLVLSVLLSVSSVAPEAVDEMCIHSLCRLGAPLERKSL